MAKPWNLLNHTLHLKIVYHDSKRPFSIRLKSWMIQSTIGAPLNGVINTTPKSSSTRAPFLVSPALFLLEQNAMDRRGQSGGGRRGDEGRRQGGGRGGPWMQQYCLDCFDFARCFIDMGGSRSDTPLCKISGPANKMVRFGTPKRLHFSPGTLNRALKFRIFTYIS